MGTASGGGFRELAAVVVCAAGLTLLSTYPLGLELGQAGRLDTADGQVSIWNVAWVARTLVVDPRHLLDANIFYPHHRTLVYSEANLGAGVLAVPAYWATRNPYFALNTVVLLAFILSAAGAYYLGRYLTGDRRAAAVSAICFAFCPYVFARTAQIQLLLTAGLPLSLLAFHRLVDRLSIGRAAALGAVLAAQTYCCAYYGVFAALMVGVAVTVIAVGQSRWRRPSYWGCMALAAGVAAALILPLYSLYATLQQTTGFSRPLDEARQFSADWRAYFASSAHAHTWMLRLIGHWKDVLFPGFLVTGFGTAGAMHAWRWGSVAPRESARGGPRSAEGLLAWGPAAQAGSRTRDGAPSRRNGHGRQEIAALYAILAVLSFWASLGPDAGLYTVLYRFVPAFTLMHAPSRFGLLVVFALSVLATIGVAAFLARRRRSTLVGLILVVLAAAELSVSLNFRQAAPLSPAYRVLAALPRGPVIEMPFFELRPFLPRHAEYMLNATSHWMPLVNGYSDFMPDDFRENAIKLAPFPFPVSFKVLEPLGVRYAVFHMNVYDDPTRRQVSGRIDQFAQYLRPLYIDRETRLYEIVGAPP